MKRIRTRTRIDILASDQRTSPVRWGRRIYFAILLALVFLGLDWAIGDALILRADGLVIADRSVAAATYAARVTKVLVTEGQRVAAGDVVAELESPDMLRDIAQVSARNAELSLRDVQLRARAITLASLMPLAERHARESADVVEKLDTMRTPGLVSSLRRDQALGAEYDAASGLAALRAEAALLASELPAVTHESERAGQTLDKLAASYDNGLVRAPRSGTVGTRLPAPGQVIKFGDELLQIYGDDRHVLAYLPDIYLFTLAPGDQVTLTSGSARAEGTVEALLAVTDALPPEFQSTFRPRDRGQLVRITLNTDNTFAVSQKIQVRGCALGWCFRPRSVFEAIASVWLRA